jgi:cytochrome c-type biogenesis protein CcmH
MTRATAIAPDFADPSAVARSVRTGASYEPRQLVSGAIAYAAVVALQDKAFVEGVRVYAKDPTQRRMIAYEIMKDPAQEGRARNLSKELRCMVCQNQSIDDSDAPLARDLRLLVRERIATGESDKQVLDFLVARYGEFVLLKPRLNLHTLLLWLLTPLVLIGGGVALWWHNRRRGRAAGDDDGVMTLTAEQEARIEKLLAAQSETKSS